MEIEYKKEPTEIKETDILPETQQVVLTLTTQREIDQLYALLDYNPIRRALKIGGSLDTWYSAKVFLNATDYLFWYNRLSNMLEGE